jgi:hypothetical protein
VSKIRVEVDPLKLRPVDVPIIEPDISKTYNATGWKPEISLDRTISDMLAYWREHIDVSEMRYFFIEGKYDIVDYWRDKFIWQIPCAQTADGRPDGYF